MDAPLLETRQKPRSPGSPRRLFWAAVLGLTCGVLSWLALRRMVSALVVLAHLSGLKGGPEATVRTTDVVITDGALRVRAREYVPATFARACLVVGHGVHHLGIDEPRLVRFARELSQTGAVVVTPELADLADYRITRSGSDVLSSAVHHASRRCGGLKVGLVGFSFAGGLALLSAIEPSVGKELGYVASIGGYHDLSRVLGFLVDGTANGPGGVAHRKPHEYGMVVLLYGYLDHFVPAVDLGAVRGAVRAWLEEDRALAWARASRVETAEGEAVFLQLASGRIGEMAGRIREVVAGHASELAELSPRGKLGRIAVPVYLLHGTGDSVIPKEETEWAGLELEGRRHVALVSPLIEHVEVNGGVHVADGYRLVDFLSRLL